MADDLEQYARKINSKITEEDNWEVYFNLSNNRVEQTFSGFRPYYPLPKTKDYRKGFMYRHFIVRYDGAVTEISNKEASRKKGSMPNDLYTYLVIKWRLVESPIAPKGLTIMNPTCADVNLFYINAGCKALTSSLKNVFKEYFVDLEEFKLFSK